MCGINGIICLNGSHADLDILIKMNGEIVHRGPDGEGYFCVGPVGLAHRRLAIIDPKGGQQPFVSDDNSLILVYNGEIYNYIEIRQELQNDYNFKTDSDTEVLIYAYDKWGIDKALEKFQGMFAFALFNRKNKKIYIVRDRMGIKPLFYYLDNQKVIFSSELPPILKAPNISINFDVKSFAQYLRYQYIPSPNTIYNNINKLDSGTYLEIDIQKKNIQQKRYWNLNNLSPISTSISDCLEEFNCLFDEIIKLYVRSDVPFGAFLSGGVDSSLVSANMQKFLDLPLQTFSVGYDDENYSELQYSRIASNIIGSVHKEIKVYPDFSVEFLENLIKKFGEPFADSSFIPTYYVSKLASESVKMVLSGDGADELFGGYNSYLTLIRNFSSNNQWNKILSNIKNSFSKITSNRFKHIPLQIIPHLNQHNAQRENFSENELKMLFPSVKTELERNWNWLNPNYEKLDPLTWFQLQDFHTYMVDDVLCKVDRMSMANSLEVRVPFLDHKIVEFAFRLPISMKIDISKNENSFVSKILLKKSASRFYPTSFLNRPKQGFGIPLLDWCLSPYKNIIIDTLGNSNSSLYNYLDKKIVQSWLKEFYNGNTRRYNQIWYLFIAELWMKIKE